jgi:hypothetical protein
MRKLQQSSTSENSAIIASSEPAVCNTLGITSSHPCPNIVSDLHVLAIFTILYKKENKISEVKGEALNTYRALTAFYRAIIILIVHWSCIWAAGRLNPDDHFSFLGVNS